MRNDLSLVLTQLQVREGSWGGGAVGVWWGCGGGAVGCRGLVSHLPISIGRDVEHMNLHWTTEN